jgi:hypothetical protein
MCKCKTETNGDWFKKKKLAARSRYQKKLTLQAAGFKNYLSYKFILVLENSWTTGRAPALVASKIICRF